ncbi:MAG: glycosyltransferase family 39 protein, partial [bacterium]|nr:glycosyltransferase family 39 protein [bacterium]
MRRCFEKQWVPAGLLGLWALFYMGFTLPLIPVAADNIRMVEVFSADESLAAATVSHLFRAGTLELQGFSYGGLFYYLPLGLLKGWAAVGGDVDERVIILVLRGLCALAGLGCLWATYRLGVQTLGSGAGALAALFLAATPVFLRWSVEIHPDLPQLFWMLCALLWCCRLVRVFEMKAVVWATVFAGLAFGTKYGGVFLLPLIAGCILVGQAEDGLEFRRRGGKRVLLAMLLVPVMFLLVFLVSNPYALIHFETFRSDVAFEREHLQFGHMFKVDSAGFRWVGMLGGILGVVASVLFVVQAVRQVWPGCRIRVDRVVLLVWIVGYTGYLVGTANLQAARHLLPVLPAVWLFVADGCLALWRWVKTRWATPAVYLVLPVLVVFVGGQNGVDAGRLFEEKLWRVTSRSELVAGQWMAERFPEKTSILFDAYAYIPPQFRNVMRISLGQSYLIVHHLQPDLLVVRQAVAKDFQDVTKAESARIGKDAFLDAHYFYKFLEEGRIPTYRLEKEFDGVAVYRRTDVPLGATPRAAWQERVELLRNRQIRGAAVARETMGDVHFSQGQFQETLREYRLGVEIVPDHVQLQYKLGSVFLIVGQKEEARQVFEEVFGKIAGLPDRDRASIRHDLSRKYFEAGLYEEAVVQAEVALR